MSKHSKCICTYKKLTYPFAFATDKFVNFSLLGNIPKPLCNQSFL